MFEIKKQVVEWDDTLWVVKRMIPESYQFDISEYRQYLNADKVAKKNGYYFFLEEVKEVGILEEISYIEEN
jgi:Zn-dependent oligopeptidase